MSKPRISVIVTAHNRKQFIKEALLSLINQSISKSLYEIIVVKNYKDDIIDDFINNIGALNEFIPGESSVTEKYAAGISKSQGEIICFLEDDDLYKRNRLETINKIFTENRDVVYYHNECSCIDKDSRFINCKSNEITERRFAIIDTSRISTRLFRKMESNFRLDYNVSSIAVRKEVLSDKLIDLKKIRTMGDVFIFYASVFYLKKIVADPSKLTFIRFHDSLSRASGSFDNFIARNKEIRKLDLEDYQRLSEIFSVPELNEYFQCRITMRKVFLNLVTERTSRKDEISNTLSFMPCALILGKSFPLNLFFMSVLHVLFPDASNYLYYRNTQLEMEKENTQNT